MTPRFVGRVGLADAVTTANAALGFLAVVVAPTDVDLAARLVLLAAIADGADGLLAQRYGGTPVGEYLDGLADVVSFGVAPATVVVVSVTATRTETWLAVAAHAVPALFVVAAVVRLALYTAYDVEEDSTVGVQSTLAAVVLAAAVLAGVGAVAVLAGAAVLTYLMVAAVRYPDLLPRDALAMGVVQAGAVLAPDLLDGALPTALLVAALGYLVLAPRFYWR